MKKVKVIFHCSDSSFGNAALLAKWHVLPIPNGRGWSNIGYHKVLLNGWLASGLYDDALDGHVETGRPLDSDPFISSKEIGAHVRGQNRNSVGICLIGKSGNFTDRQLNSALEELYKLEKQFGEIEICQHSDYDKRKPFCAGLDMVKFKQNYEFYKQARDSEAAKL